MISKRFPTQWFIGAALLWPFLAVSAGFATGAEILRRVEARVLTSSGVEEENIPSLGIGGVLRGLISVLVPLGLFLLSSGAWLGVTAALFLAALAAWSNFQDILSVYRQME